MAKKDTQLKEGLKIKLEVVDENPRHYIVKYDDRTFPIKKFDFQKRPGTSRPLNLQCIVDRTDGQRIFFKQDLAPVFAERYKVGQIYDFTVEADMTGATRPHYKVSDGSGYWLPLPAHDGDNLNKGDRVKLRVTAIKGIYLGLRLVKDYLPADSKVIKLADLAQRFGLRFLRLVAQLRRAGALPETTQLYEADDRQWVLTAAGEAREAIFSLDNNIVSRNRLAEGVKVFRDALTYLLEDSGFLRDTPDAARGTIQEDLARTVSRADDLLTALQLKEHERERFVKETFEKIRRSGYLYHPESKLRTLMYIFSLRSDLIDRKMDELIEIIQQGDTNNWKAEPFRSAFVEQLQLYIDANHMQFDTVSDAESDGEIADRLDRMIRALAIQQLLEEDTDLSQEALINRSRLYRYYAFMKHAERDKMLEKSLRVLLNGDIESGEYSWSDTKDVTRLSRRLLHDLDQPVGIQRYESRGCMMRISDNRISFAAADDAATRAILPNLSLWHDIQVYLPTLLPPDYRTPRSISDYKGVWSEIERNLFQPRRKELPEEKVVVVPRTRQPEVGESVGIRIDDVSEEDPLVYDCTVVETGFTGSGTIDVKEISGASRALRIEAFRDEKGRPMEFMAKVIGTADDGTLHFSMTDGIRSMLRDNIGVDDEVNGVINNVPSPRNGFTFTALTEHGYIVSISPDETTSSLVCGSQIKLVITGFLDNGRIIKAKYIGPSDDEEMVEYEKSLETLLFTYGRELPDSPQESSDDGGVDTSDSDSDEPLTDDVAREVMHIIARRADMDTDLVRSYNYFAAARLLARMISDKPDDQMRLYYDQRCRVLEILDDFATNGRIDLESLSAFNAEIMRGSASNPYSIKLKILAAMERPEHTSSVWDIVSKTNSDEISQLGRLVIAYNAIDGFKLGEEQRKIREHIYSLLKLDIERQPDQIAGGIESQTVEFKTSAAYPAGGVMRLDVKRQMAELVQVICGFLNSTGGRLYIGVSDEGYVRGLANDLEHFGSLDKLMLELHNSIHKQLGFIAGYANYINIQPEHYGEKTIVSVDIKPLPTPVAANGIYYERQGSSTEYVPKDKEAEFLRRRNNTFATPHAPVHQTVKTPVQQADMPDEQKPSAPTPTPAPAPATVSQKESIATSRLRRNYLHYDGSSDFRAPNTYLFINLDASYQISQDELWTDEDAALALGLTEEEAAGSVVVVYTSGHVARVSVDSLFKSRRAKLSVKEPIAFISPVNQTDGLLVYFKDEKGVIFKQFFTPEQIPNAKPTDMGERIIPGRPIQCETVCAECQSNFAAIQRNGQRVGRTASELLTDIDDSYRRLG